MCEAAWLAGFVGALVCDFPHAAKRRKWFLCLEVSEPALVKQAGPRNCHCEQNAGQQKQKQCCDEGRALSCTLWRARFINAERFKHPRMGKSPRLEAEIDRAADWGEASEADFYEVTPEAVAAARACLEAVGLRWGGCQCPWATHGLRNGREDSQATKPVRCPLALRFGAACALQWLEHLRTSACQMRQRNLSLADTSDAGDGDVVVIRQLPHFSARLQQYHLDSLHHLLRLVRFVDASAVMETDCPGKVQRKRQGEMAAKLRQHDRSMVAAVQRVVQRAQSRMMGAAGKQCNIGDTIKGQEVPDRALLALHGQDIVHAMHSSVTTFYGPDDYAKQ